MRIRDSYRALIETLTPLYGDKEAASIARIALEDGLDIRDRASTLSLDAKQIQVFEAITARLRNNEPIQYITGKTKFAGLWLKTDPRALIPRQETEELVALLLEENKDKKYEPLAVLDIGAGSGCIAVTLKKKYPAWQVTAVDISPGALALADENAHINACDVSFVELDILDENNWNLLPGFDIVVSNPPYIPFREKSLMPSQVLNHEPSLALFVPDEDPLLFYKAIINFCKKKLKAGGQCYIECNEFNAKEVFDLFRNIGFETLLEKDIQGKDRFVKGIKDEG